MHQIKFNSKALIITKINKIWGNYFTLFVVVEIKKMIDTVWGRPIKIFVHNQIFDEQVNI